MGIICEVSEPMPELHRSATWLNYKDIDIDDPKYNWMPFGRQKYDRYFYCDQTHSRRGLTADEFYNGHRK